MDQYPKVIQWNANIQIHTNDTNLIPIHKSFIRIISIIGINSYISIVMSSNEQSLKNAIGDFLKAANLSGKLAEQKVIDGWEKIMGKMIAKHTRQISIYDKKLFLQIDSAPLKQELFYSREKIIKMMNEEAGEEVIKEVVIRW